MKIYEDLNRAWPIVVTQQESNTFSVRYGHQEKESLSYSQACKELGECIFHSLTCEGVIDTDLYSC